MRPEQKCNTCSEAVNISWTESVEDRIDCFERTPCPLCGKGCVFVADINGVTTTYRCCHCGK